MTLVKILGALAGIVLFLAWLLAMSMGSGKKTPQ